MSRARASVDGGYTRRTVTLPTDLDDKISEHLEKNPGMTRSHFVTKAAEQALSLGTGKKKA